MDPRSSRVSKLFVVAWCLGRADPAALIVFYGTLDYRWQILLSAKHSRSYVLKLSYEI